METNKSKMSDKSSEPQHETPNKPLTPPPSTYMQAYQNPWTPNNSLTIAGSSSYPSWWQGQAWSMPVIQYESLNDPKRPFNYPVGAATLAFSEIVLRMFGEKNLDSMKIISDKNLQQYKSLVIKEPEENRKISSIPKINLEGASLSAASERMGSPYEGHGANSAYESTKGLSKDFSSTRKQQSNMMLKNGQDAQKETCLENCNNVHENRTFVENPNKLNHDLEKELNAYGSNTHLEKQDFPSTKKQQCNMMLENGQDAPNETRLENCNDVHGNRSVKAKPTKLKKKLEEGKDLIPSEANPQLEKLEQDFSSTKKQQCNTMLENGQDAMKETHLENCNDVDGNKGTTKNQTKRKRKSRKDLNASITNPELEKLEIERRKERKRQSKRASAKRAKLRKEKECEELGKTIDNLKAENSELKKKLHSFSEELVQVVNENDSILEELVEEYGPESVASLMNSYPATPESVASGSENNS